MTAVRWSSLRWLLWGELILAASGCSSGGSGGPPPATDPPVAIPNISAQPANQSVPMGLPASFSIVASGPSLVYQWQKDNAAIPGANASSYTTPATAFADNGSSFSVTVSNSGGAVTSSSASLTVTARAPAAGDLRFQQVDSPATVNGWGNIAAISTNVNGRGAAYYSPAVGTPLFAGSGGNCVQPPVDDGVGCSWLYSVYAISATSSPAVTSAYGGDYYANFMADLQPGNSSVLVFPDGGITPASTASVITSLDLESGSNLFGLSWIQSSQSSAFTMIENTVASTDLPAAATQEGAAGRVITAISADQGQVTYLAYAWQSDTVTVYELQTLTAAPADAATAAAQLASEGYIISATGLADAGGDVFLVGTRVQGDTLARPFMTAQGSAVATMQQQGYAIVGVIVNSMLSDPYVYLGER